LKNYYAILFYLSILFGSFFIFSGAKYQVVASAKTALENGSQGVPVKSLVSSTIASPRAGFGEIPAKIQPSTTSVYAYITEQAKKVGIDPIIAEWIVGKESQDGQNLYGDDSQSLGTWMISTVWHPEVPRSCSLSLQCSTSWSLAWLKKGNANQWSTFACKYVWFYKDAVATFGLPPKGFISPKYCKPIK
jgi:hypothetical protein